MLKIEPTFKPDKRLKNFYVKANRLWFDGTLPSDTVVGWNSEIPGYGLTLGIEDEDTKHTFYIIYIDKKKHYDFRQSLLTLLHEMAHVKLRSTRHGMKFEEELVRIAIRGGFKGLW